MEGYAYYLVGSAATLALLYAGYALTLRGETFHRLKRAALTGIVLASLLLPLAATRLERPPLPDWLAMPKRSASSALPTRHALTTAIIDQPLSAPPTSAPPWAPVVLCLWALGAAMALSRYALSLAAFTRLVRKGQNAGLRRGCRVVLNGSVPSPVSWMHWVIISPADLQAHGSLLLAHEEGHVRLHHTWDRLVCDIAVRLQWFNPAAWLLLRELKAVHEYEADRYALNQDIDKDKYPVLLIRKATHAGLQPAAAGWNYSPLKTRLKMMYKPQSRPRRRLRALWLALPATLALTAMARPTAETFGAQPVAPHSSQAHWDADKAATHLTTEREAALTEPVAKDTPATSQNAAGDSIYESPDTPPTYPGHTAALLKDIAKNCLFPAKELEKAQKAKTDINGTVTVRFVVNAQGYVERPQVVRGMSQAFNEAALAAVKKLKRFTPGQVDGKPVATWITLPVRFATK